MARSDFVSEIAYNSGCKGLMVFIRMRS